jgi:hypothetical protein
MEPVTVEFKTIPGWTKPANQKVNISDSVTATVTGTYVQQVGSLQVTLSPADAVSAGARWRREGQITWRNSGATEGGIPIGPVTIEFNTVAGWTTPVNQDSTITDGGTATVTGTYVQQVGALRVTLSPSGAVSAGAQWRMVGDEWWRSSSLALGLPVGQLTIEFKSVTGWDAPTNQNVSITNGGMATVTGIYVQQTGQLKVTLSPVGAVSAGAQWRRTGTTEWSDSGATEMGVPVGPVTLEFKTVPGWTTPPNQDANIADGTTATSAGTYIQQFSTLRVTLSPSGAVSAGAQWRRIGTAVWFDDGVTESDVAVGPVTIEFKTVSGWTTPINQDVYVSDGSTATATGTYVQQIGSLQVTLSPAGAVSAGAQWRRVGTSPWLPTPWRNSGETATGIAVGQAIIEFKPVTGWNAPTNQSVMITADSTAAATGTYVQQTGSLQVTLSPAGVVSAGAQWRRVGQTAWCDNGEIETDLPVGTMTIEFKAMAGWNTPSNRTVKITDGNMATITTVYTQTGSLRVTLSPYGASSAGAQWRRVGETTWCNSEHTENGLPVGEITVEFKPVNSWTTPANQVLLIILGETTTATGEYTEPGVRDQAQGLLLGFDGADNNGDGVLSLAEAQAIRPSLSLTAFNQLDTNHDGGISRAELDAYLNPGPGGCDGCLGGKGAFPWTDWKRFLGDLMLLGVSLVVLLAMGRGHAARR